MAVQEILSHKQIEAFFHDEFVEDQARHFIDLMRASGRAPVSVTDVGGGCGFFARRVSDLARCRVRVIDSDETSVAVCRSAGVEAVLGNALSPQINGDEDVVAFNLVLHHLVGRSERITRDLQRTALMVWQDRASSVFVNEYCYEAYVGNVSGWLIYQITKNSVLSRLGRAVSRFVPSLRANTFGVGVRFRGHGEWTRLFEEAGFVVKSTRIGNSEVVSLARRMLLIRSIRRDSFLLVRAAAQ